MSLHRTPELHNLLQAVAEQHVVHFNGLCGAHPEGWGWQGMAHMPQQTEQDLDTLRHARLISFTTPADPCGNRVLLTMSGSERLADWNVRWPKGEPVVEDLSRYAEDGAYRVADYRWPIVSTLYPRWSYITTVVVDLTLQYGITPSEPELAVVDSFHEEYLAHWYRPGWVDQMREKYAFDVDGGANGRYLVKVAEGSWKYRKGSWQHGAWPFHGAEPMTLIQLLDHIHTIGSDREPMPRWQEWKARHADVFGAVSA